MADRRAYCRKKRLEFLHSRFKPLVGRYVDFLEDKAVANSDFADAMESFGRNHRCDYGLRFYNNFCAGCEKVNQCWTLAKVGMHGCAPLMVRKWMPTRDAQSMLAKKQDFAEKKLNLPWEENIRVMHSICGDDIKSRITRRISEFQPLMVALAAEVALRTKTVVGNGEDSALGILYAVVVSMDMIGLGAMVNPARFMEIMKDNPEKTIWKTFRKAYGNAVMGDEGNLQRVWKLNMVIYKQLTEDGVMLTMEQACKIVETALDKSICGGRFKLAELAKNSPIVPVRPAPTGSDGHPPLSPLENTDKDKDIGKDNYI